MNKFIYILLFTLLFCKSQQKIEVPVNDSINNSKEETNITIPDTHDNKSETQIDTKPEIDTNVTKPAYTEESNIANLTTEENIQENLEQKKLILNYKEKIQNEEGEYINQRNLFLREKEIIITIHSIIKNEEEKYHENKEKFILELEYARKNQIEILNKIDPERNAFWRVEAYKDFPEVLQITVNSEEYFICEISDEINYYLLNEFKCRHIIKKISKEFLESLDYPEISIFELLPDKKGLYIIFEKMNNKNFPFTIENQKKEKYFVNFIESDGVYLIKLGISQIKTISGKKRYYFNIISPLNILFKIP